MIQQHIRAEYQIGKSGITDNVVKDIVARLKKKKRLKIKFLQSAIKGKDKESLFNELARKTGSKIISKIGFTVVLRYAVN